MAVTSCVITDTLPADSTPKSFTRSGFGTPDAAIVIIGRANTVNNPQPEFDVSIGFWDGTNQYAASAHAIDNLDTTITSRFRYSNRIGGFRYHDGTNYVNIAQWTIANVTDGVQFTLTDDNTGAGHHATVILFKGLTNKKVGTFAFPGTASEVDVSDVGFKPDVVFMVDPVSGTAYSTALAESAEGSHINFGVAHNSSADVISQAGVTFASYNAVGTSQVNTSIHDKILRRWYADSTPASFTTSISAFDANGFSVTPSGATSSRPFYLALELPDPDDAYVGIIDSKTSTGTQAYTGVGFTPLAILLASTTETAINQSSTSPTGALYFGATDGTEEQSIIWMDQDAQNVSNVASRADTANVLNLRFHDDTVDAVAAYSSFDSDGWTLNYSDGSSSARKILAFAIGDSTAGGGGATGTLSVSLSDVTVSAAGALTIAGSASNTLAAVGLSGAGAVAIAGSASNTLGAATLSASGSVLSGVTGNLAQTLAAATLAGSGAVAITGSLAQTLLAAALSGAGAVAVQGAAANTLGGASLAASGNVGSVPITGDLAVTLSNLAAAGAGAVEVTGSLAQTLNNAALAAGGAVLITGSLAQALANAGLVAAGGDAVLVIGSLDGTLRAYPALSGTLELDAALVANLRLRQGT